MVPSESHTLASAGSSPAPATHTTSTTTITMPLYTTAPGHRVKRMLSEGFRLLAVQQGQVSIDVTPDIIALLDCRPASHQLPPHFPIKVRRPVISEQPGVPVDLSKLQIASGRRKESIDSQ